MAKKIFKVALVIFLLLGVSYLGTCVYANLVTFKTDKSPSPPSIDKATYQVLLQSTGRIIYTDKYKTEGNDYTPYGYWEKRGTKYIYIKSELPLSSKAFGKIIVTRRQ